MSESKHTPGPWEWAHCDDGDFALLKGDGRYVLSPENTPGAAAWVDVSDADACLIVAAPDLLEAAKALVECDEARKDVQPLFERACRLARAAIAKVEAGRAALEQRS